MINVNYSEGVRSEGNSFELNIGTKLPVWIGAISLICAAFFLVKYSLESGWLSPLVRVGLGAAFGASLVAAGQWTVKHARIANHERISQGLVGSGIVSLYVSLYSAVSLYHVLPPLFGFVAMTAVTALAVIMSLRHGQPIAAFGLLGSLLTPALIGSPEPDAMALFTYLFLLFSGMFFILARRGWWIMAALALAGVFIWTGFWYLTVFTSGDAFVLVIFAVAVCAAVLAITRQHVLEESVLKSKSISIHGLNTLAIFGSALTIIWLGFQITLSLFDWSMLGLLSLGCMGLVYFRPDIYERVLWTKLAADLVLFFIWSQNVTLESTLMLVAGMTAIYVALPSLVMRNVPDPRIWAGMQLVASIALYVTCYYRIDLAPGFEENAFWGLIALALAGIFIHQAKEMRLRYQTDEQIRNHLVAIYALAATSFISLGLSIELPWEYVPLAFAAQAMATMWVYNRTGIMFLKRVVMILTGIFVVMNYEQIMLFSSLILDSLFSELPSRHLVINTMLDEPLVRLGLPAMFMGLALLIHLREENAERSLSHVLLGTSLALAFGTAYYLVRDIFQIAPDFFALQAGFMERGTITLLIAALGFTLIAGSGRTGVDILKTWGLGLFHLAMLRIFWFDLLILNPYMDKTQFVGRLPLLNGVTLTYGTGVLLAAWAVYSPVWQKKASLIRGTYKLLGFVLLFALSSLSVRQYFHGSMLAIGDISSAEFYAYSVIWLLTGLALLTFGIVRQNKTARIASLAFMLLTVGKVFLLDAAALEGLYRVFSFLGLGYSLIALSYFYSRFISGNENAKPENDSGPWWF